MKIERIRIKNFRALCDVELRIASQMAVFVGENGSGKSTLFSVFGFLKDALDKNVSIALQRIGGYKEVVTRGHEGEPIVIEIQFRMEIVGVNRLVTYHLEIAKNEQNMPAVRREILRYKRSSRGAPFHFLDFRGGSGYAISNEEDFNKPDRELEREQQTLDAPNILAIKGLGQFQRFNAANAFHRLIENWHASDFHITSARQRGEVGGFAEHLSESGDNLAQVAHDLYENNRDVFDKILEEFKFNLPDISEVTTNVTEDGHVLLRFGDRSFKDPFIARHVSDGTIKLFAYMVLLHDPRPHSFLYIEEPENQLYPTVLSKLVPALRKYAKRGGQVFVSTHSPDFLNHAEPHEVFLLKKHDSETKVHPISENQIIMDLMKEGDRLGWLWRQCNLEP